MEDKYYIKIREELQNNEVYKKIKDYSKNRHDLSTYFNVGKILIEAQGGEARAKYGDNLIKEYSLKLMKDVDKKFNYKTLLRIRQFYLFCEKFATVSRQLSFSHYVELLPLKDINEINYYIKIVEKQNLGVRKLREKIKAKEYQRLPIDTKNKLITTNKSDDKYEVTDFIKNPIIIENTKNYNKITEKNLQDLILENIPLFLEQLGDGFTFMKNEYKISYEGINNYIDILLHNYIYNCFCVIELKTIKLKKEHIGQIQIYMNYIDRHVKLPSQNDTIGIIICKEEDKFVMHYLNNNKITSTKYITI